MMALRELQVSGRDLMSEGWGEPGSPHSCGHSEPTSPLGSPELPPCAGGADLLRAENDEVSGGGRASLEARFCAA